MDNLTRLIGPIPQHYTGATEDGPYAHPGGPCPVWGGYRPILVDVPLSWLASEVQEIVTQPGTCWGSEGRSLRGAIYRAHTTDTLLLQTPEGWYVAAPARPTRRAVVIAADALRGGYPLPGGLLPEEVVEAERIHAAGAQAHGVTLPWEGVEEPDQLAPSEGMEPVYRRTTDEE